MDLEKKLNLEVVSQENYEQYTKESKVIHEQRREINKFFNEKTKQKKMAQRKDLQNIVKDFNNNASKERKSDIIPKNEVEGKKAGTSVAMKKSKQKREIQMTEKKKEMVQNQQDNMICQNLIKQYKRMGIFLHAESKSAISVYKDYPIQILDKKNKSLGLNIRYNLGVWTELKKNLSINNKNYTSIKDEFQKWLDEALKNANPAQEVQELYDHLFRKDTKSEKHTFFKVEPQNVPYLSRLEYKLINLWKKTSKQGWTFLDKTKKIYEDWAEEANEIIYVDTIEKELNFNSYEQGFPKARRMERKIVMYLGPTNSGKTYHALNELKEAEYGIYLAPLRLMAAEGQEALTERGLVTNLVTGEEQHLLPDATHISSTIEMCPMGERFDVAVIDEIQMIGDDSRGWAWSQALIGVQAQKLILVGSEECLPFVVPVLEALGEEFEIKRFERKTPLVVREQPLSKLKELHAGDCMVVFSRKAALEMKSNIEALGKKCAVIYGNLSPEVRRAEAAKFKTGEAPILVATDAIGMGLNLPIKRLFFSTMEKYDGISRRELKVTEVKQIAGRSGRFGHAEIGEVGIYEPDFVAQQLLKKSIYQGYELPHDTRISIAPNLNQIEKICEVIGKKDLYTALVFFREKLIKDHPYYKAANLDDMLEVAGMLKTKKLDLEMGLNYACVPIDTSNELHVKSFYTWLGNHKKEVENKHVDLPDGIKFDKQDPQSLYDAENYVKICMAYRWLHYKYPEYYPHIEETIANVKLANKYIEKVLTKQIQLAKIKRVRR